MADDTDTKRRLADEAFAARILPSGDQEIAHSNADGVLIEALRHAGYNLTADAWEENSGSWWWA